MEFLGNQRQSFSERFDISHVAASIAASSAVNVIAVSATAAAVAAAAAAAAAAGAAAAAVAAADTGGGVAMAGWMAGPLQHPVALWPMCG